MVYVCVHGKVKLMCCLNIIDIDAIICVYTYIHTYIHIYIHPCMHAYTAALKMSFAGVLWDFSESGQA